MSTEAGVDVLGLGALEQAALVRSGEVSARELVEASLAAIERRNGELGAFVTLCPERALAEADAVRPRDPRPLCGVPVGIKDLLSATEGLPTTHGSRAFGDWVADHDSAHVRRLREAGAIVVGKTNTPELGCGRSPRTPASARPAIRGGRRCRPAARPAGARRPWPPAWSRSPTEATSGARSACPPPAAASSA
jgi:Asp-tRNA(Asn)/Glu-tRNA(Gln) amidotransferase A subunit family amidase